MATAYVLHVLSVIIWVGGMFFAYVVLRPVAAGLLEPSLRFPLWGQVFERYFVWVWVAVSTLLLTGFGMLLRIYGGMAGAPIYVHVMLGIGILMMLIFGHLYFAPYRRLRKAVAAADWDMAGRQLGQMRWIVGLNLSLGIFVVAVATLGRML